MTSGSLMKVESIAECSHWSILQYFWPALSDNWSRKAIFGLLEWPLYTGFTVIENLFNNSFVYGEPDENVHVYHLMITIELICQSINLV